MSHYIVLVKQVPDVSQITDNAFDPNTGNLIRTRLPSVINELDAQALAFAWRMKFISADTEAKIVCLTMGPPMAAEVLRYGLSRCADDAILLTDKSLGGADTWATANPLAYAIRKIVAERWNNTTDYYIVAGMQSVDGDTAQVPAQIAAELKIPCVAYATDVVWDGNAFEFTRIISGGSQVVRPRSKPAIITVAKYEYTLYPSFARTRQANRFTLTQWGAADVKATAIGVAGSKTRVIRVFPPEKTTRKCKHLATVQELADCIRQTLTQADTAAQKSQAQTMPYILPAKRASVFDRFWEGTEKEIEDYKALAYRLRELGISKLEQITDEVKEKILQSEHIKFHKKALDDMLEGCRHITPSYTGDVWVMAEHDEGQIHPATLELIGKARQLADSLEVHVGVVLVGDNVQPLADTLIAAGADKVYLIEHPKLAQFDPVSYCKAVCAAFNQYKPQIFLYGATPVGRVLAPMVSYRVGCGLTADCTGLDIRDSSRKEQIAILMQTRPALGGNVMATISTKDSSCQMATARPGVMKRLPPDPARKGQVIPLQVDISDNDLSLYILKTERGHGKVNFDSDVIISGGKGMQSRENYHRLLDDLCQIVKRKFNVSVEKGASRTAVEQGFTERIHQVGQTGTAVGPKLYIAIGISGAIQHMIGVANSGTIVAINSDPNAPIFKQCDYYLVGHAEKVVPELAAALNSQ